MAGPPALIAATVRTAPAGAVGVQLLLAAGDGEVPGTGDGDEGAGDGGVAVGDGEAGVGPLGEGSTGAMPRSYTCV
jgi:hypothetical protein